MIVMIFTTLKAEKGGEKQLVLTLNKKLFP